MIYGYDYKLVILIILLALVVTSTLPMIKAALRMIIQIIGFIGLINVPFLPVDQNNNFAIFTSPKEYFSVTQAINKKLQMRLPTLDIQLHANSEKNCKKFMTNLNDQFGPKH